jgi:AcrR family transcriptional regulator
VPRQHNAASRLKEDKNKQQERATRILDAAAELIQRWGYRKTTIDDIAKQAGVAKGTIYLHWKTREELFMALLIRERMKVGQGLEQRRASDPEGATLHGVIKHSLLASMNNPLLKAVILRDSDMLGELVHSEFGKTDAEQRTAAARTFLELLRDKALIRTDIDLDTQLYMLQAITTGFIIVDQFLPDTLQSSTEVAAEMAAETVRRTFEVRSPTLEEQQETARIYNHILKTERERI